MYRTNIQKINIKIALLRGTLVAQSVECPTLGFSSVHVPRVMGSCPISGSVLSVEPAWDSLSPSLSAPPPLMRTLSLSLSLSLSNKKKDNPSEGQERK